MAVRLLVRGQLRARWKRYVLVAASFATGLFSFFLMTMVAEGAREAIVEPVAAVLTGDVRITNQTGELAGGKVWNDYRPAAAEVARATGGRVAPRFESNYITVRGAAFENWSAGLLLGVDPNHVEEAEALRPYMIWGRPVEALDAINPGTGRAYAPLVLGSPAVKRLNLTLNASGTPDFSQVLTLTSGRIHAETGVPVPYTVEAVLVGVFETGLEPLDKFTAYVPLSAARVLAGARQGDPVANALVVRGGDADGATAWAREHPGIRAVTHDEFAFDYMGSVLVVIQVSSYAAMTFFFAALLVWLVHETGVLVRTDQAVLSSLRAIGVPDRSIHASYAAPAALGVAAGALVALMAAWILSWTAPPLSWSLSGLRANIPWRVEPRAILLVALAAVAASLVAAWAAARRVQRLNILEGLRPT